MKKTAHDLALPSQFDLTRDMTLEHARASAGELGNHAIDEFKAGRLSRRALLRHASLLGVS
ncbi:MAG: peptide ABC transporter substrate-binding protein, partial [Caballeronia sp.]